MLKVYSVLLIMFLSIPLSHAGNKIKVYCDKGWDLKSFGDGVYTCHQSVKVGKKATHDVGCNSGFHLNPLNGLDECKAVIGQKKHKPKCFAPLAQGNLKYIKQRGQDICKEEPKTITNSKSPSIKNQ